MPLRRQDRGEVGALHAASNGTGTSAPDGPQNRLERGRGQWKQEPTKIDTPSNAHPTPSRPKNPFSSGISNNLHSSNQRSHSGDIHRHRTNPNSRSLVSPALGMTAHHHSKSSSSSNPFMPLTSKKPKRVSPAIAEGTDLVSSPKPFTPSGDTRPSNHDRSEASIAAQHSQTEDPFDPSRPFDTDSERSAKRRKIDRGNAPSPSRPSNQREVTDIDQAEDLGEPISQSQSDDPMLLRPGSLPPNSPRHGNSISQILGVAENSHQHHPFAQKKEKRVLLPEPGPNTRILKAAQQEEPTFVSSRENSTADETDSIQEPDDFDGDLQLQSSKVSRKKRKLTPSGKTEFPENRVRDRVISYNRQSLPEVDLIAKSVQRTGDKSKIHAMKRRNEKTKDLFGGPRSENAHNLNKPPQTVRGKRKYSDSIATSVTPFQNGGRGHGVGKEILLPIEVWALGSNIIESVTSDDSRPKFWLRIQGGIISVLGAPIEKENLLLRYDLGTDINCQELPSGSTSWKDFPLLIFTLREIVRTWPFVEKMARFGTKPLIAIRLYKSHTNWTNVTYSSLISALKERVCGMGYLNTTALRTRWGNVVDDTIEPPTSPATGGKSKPKPRPTYVGSSTNQASSSSSSLEHQVVRRSARHSHHRSRKVDRPPSPPADETILLYPPSGTGAVNVTYGDLKRLEPGEYLNDSLIEFGLKLWLNDLRIDTPDFAEQVHVFSSFFYTQLNQKNLEEGYQSVRKWTSKFDLFKKKYIVVPINEHMHWYLAIICHPERALQQLPPAQFSAPTTRTKTRESLTKASPPTHSLPLEHRTSDHQSESNAGLSTSTSEAVAEQDVDESPASPRDPQDSKPRSSTSLSSLQTTLSHRSEVISETASEAEDASDPADVSMKGPSASPAPPDSPELGVVTPSKFYGDPGPSYGKKLSKPIEPREEDDQEIDELADDVDLMDVDAVSIVADVKKPDEPYVFSFDSLGARHPHALKVLSQYLIMEAKDKKGLDETVPAITKQALVPAQPNYCDCGVYLLHFVQQFMSEPEIFSRHIIEQHKSKKAAAVNKLTREQLWKHDVVASRREDMKQKLMSLSSEWKREREGEEMDKAKVERSKTPAEIISIDHDSDIEVIEVTAEPSKPAKRPQSRAPSSRRAERIR